MDADDERTMGRPRGGDATSPLDVDADDFTHSPWLYPGTAGPSSALLDDDHLVPLTATTGERLGAYRAGDHSLDELLHGRGVPSSGDRVLVVAIGSNASPAVVRRKFAGQGVSTVVPLFTGLVHEVSVGHSAHISIRGYVPAAPFAHEGAETPVIASLLDEDQLAALDRTEPNYERVLVDAPDHPLFFENGERPGHYHLYVSRRGVVGDEEGRTGLLTQEEIADYLTRAHPGYTTFRGEDAIEDVMARLARDEPGRAGLVEGLIEEGLVHDSGITGSPRALTYGETPSTFG